MIFRVNLTDDAFVGAKFSELIEIPPDLVEGKSDQEITCLMWKYAAKYAEQMHLALLQKMNQI